MDIMKKTKIEQYLQGPLWALLILAFVDIVFFFLDIRCGVILAVSLVVFLVFQMIIYSRSKQEIIKECMDFMFEQSQVQNYLLQQLPVLIYLLHYYSSDYNRKKNQVVNTRFFFYTLKKKLFS